MQNSKIIWPCVHVSCWTWDQGHHREHHFCFLPRFIIGRNGQHQTSIYDKRDFNLHITNFPFLSSNISFFQAYGVLSLSLFDTPRFAPRINVEFRGPGEFLVSYSNRDTSWNALNRPSGSFMVNTGSYSTIWSLPPTNVKWHSDPWPVTVTSPTNQTFYQFHDLDTELDLHRITSCCLHEAFATGVACQQGTLTLPDTWSRPTFWDLFMLRLLRPVFPKLPRTTTV